MIPKDFPKAVECIHPAFFTVTSGGNYIDNAYYTTVANTPLVLTPNDHFRNYQYVDIEIESFAASATALTVEMDDNTQGNTSEKYFKWVGSLLANGTRTKLRLPYKERFKKLTFTANAQYTVTVIRCVPAFDSYQWNQVAFGGGGQITTAVVGAGVTDHGFDSHKTHTFDISAGNNGGINYTFIGALVAKDFVPAQDAPNRAGDYEQYMVGPSATPTVPTYYCVLLFSPITATVTYNGLTHTFRGYILLTLSAVDFASLVLGVNCNNTSSGSVTLVLQAYTTNVNYVSNAWKDQVKIGS